MSLLNRMDAERVGGYSDKGTFCVWCCKRYSSAYFRESVDVCWPCDNFKMRHYHDYGNFFIRTIDSVEFRVYVPNEPRMSDKQINKELRSLI